MKNASKKTLRIALPIVLFFLFSCGKDAAFYVNRGNDSANKGKYDQAISDYTKALEINPMHAEAYNNRGLAYGQKGQYDQAISDFNKALEINPRDAEAYNNRGTAYGRKGQNDEAISDYSKAIEIDPESVMAYNNRAWEYTLKGQYDSAVSDLEKALEINPKNADTNNNLAWVLATAKVSAFRDGKKALELALKACELSDWKNVGYFDTLAAAYARVGDFENAVKWQERVMGSPEVAQQADLQAELQERLKFYKEHKPWPAD
jgi:tetratricopeptide (TPR) repeat protein